MLTRFFHVDRSPKTYRHEAFDGRVVNWLEPMCSMFLGSISSTILCILLSAQTVVLVYTIRITFNGLIFSSGKYCMILPNKFDATEFFWWKQWILNHIFHLFMVNTCDFVTFIGIICVPDFYVCRFFKQNESMLFEKIRLTLIRVLLLYKTSIVYIRFYRLMG